MTPAKSPLNHLPNQLSFRSLAEDDYLLNRMKNKIVGGFSTVVFETVNNSSIDFYGRFLKLKSLNSPYLSQYVEFTRLACDSSKVAFTGEHPKGAPLSAIFSELTGNQKLEIAFHLINAVNHLHKSGITIGYLSPQNIIVDKIGHSTFVRLIHYGSSYLLGNTAFNRIYNIFTLTPELIMKIPATQRSKDLFSLGVLLVSIQMGVDIHADFSLSRYWQALSSVLLEIAKSWQDVSLGNYQHILFPKSLASGDSTVSEPNPILEKIIYQLLMVDPMKRPNLDSILAFFHVNPCVPPKNVDFPPEIQLHLWKLCGKSIEKNILESKFIHVSTSLVLINYGQISRYMKHHGNEQNFAKKDYKIFVQPDKNFHLARESAREYLAQRNIIRYRSGYTNVDTYQKIAASDNRFLKFMTLYEDKTQSRKLLRSDIPNLVRCSLWSEKLTKKPISSFLFGKCYSPLAPSCKHQLSLDLPRCHQYDEAMSSNNIQSKIALIIEKVLAVNPQYSAYWQGLDSFVAPFALLYANDVETGFAAAFQMIEKFTPDYFTRHSSHALEESLKLFAKLISYNNSALGYFLRENGLTPSTFAVPWLLTCFAHVFPFSKLFRIFDEMFHRASFYPLCIGLAVLELSAVELMDAMKGDEAFKVLGNVSDLDVGTLLKMADKIYELIPCSCFYRKFAQQNWELSFKVKYSEIESDDLLVPKIDPTDFHSYFIKNEAILVVLAGKSSDFRVVTVVDDVLSEIEEKKFKSMCASRKIVGIIGDEPRKVMNLANNITELLIDKVCVVDSFWSSFQLNYDL